MAKAKAKTNPYMSRLIFHPYFKNISYDQLAAMEPELEPGAIIIRPSRKVNDSNVLLYSQFRKSKVFIFAISE